MEWLGSIVERWRRGEDPPEARFATGYDLKGKVENTKQAVAGALNLGWQVQTWRFGFIEHSARVAMIARWLAEEMDVPEEAIQILEHAAQLHEVGMIAVPQTLVQTARPLTPSELTRVRAHAVIGAEIVRAAYPSIKGDLIEYQYATLDELQVRFAEQPDILKLAAILRVADVYDTLTHPRPYQRNIPKYRWREVLTDGLGTQFEPGAAELLLRPMN